MFFCALSLRARLRMGLFWMMLLLALLYRSEVLLRCDGVKVERWVTDVGPNAPRSARKKRQSASAIS